VERLVAIAAVLDRNEEPYQATLDGNEQYASAAGALELWRRIRAEPRLKRLASSIAFIEQPVNRQHALSGDVSALAEEKPVIIDESDDSLEAFPRARRLGYTGVSSKTARASTSRCSTRRAAGCGTARKAPRATSCQVKT